MRHAGSDTAGKIDDQALAWVARLRSDACQEDDRRAFALWLAQDTRHLIAMDSALELWDDMAAVRHLPLDTTRRPAANQPRWWAAAAVAASLVLAMVLWPSLQESPSERLLQTAYGEQETFELEDGSSLQLNANSRVSVTYSDDERLLTLSRGEAYFDVVSNPARPFHVDTGNARVTAIGTAFNIKLQDEDTTITVTEGVVRITELGETGNRVPTSEVLHANQQLLASPRGLQPARAVDPAGMLAWQSGELVAEALPLPELARQLERYHGLQIIITDPDVAAMTVSGVFQLDQPGAILDALELSHNLQQVPVGEGGIQLLKARQ